MTDTPRPTPAELQTWRTDAQTICLQCDEANRRILALLDALTAKDEALALKCRELGALQAQVHLHEEHCTYDEPDREVELAREHRDDYRAQANEMQQRADAAEAESARLTAENMALRAKIAGRDQCL